MNSKIECPKCNKSDQVYPTGTGSEAGTADKDGKIIPSVRVKSYYCERCKERFSYPRLPSR